MSSRFRLGARRRTERVYRDNGWGPQLTWPVPRAEGTPLVFQLRVPVGIELVELSSLGTGDAGAVAGTEALARAAGAANAFLLGALVGGSPEEQREVVATLTVALAEVAGPPDVSKLAVGDSEITVRSDVQVEALSDKVTRVHRMSLEAVEPGADPIPMLVVQYLLETRYGALAMAFSTVRTDMMGEWALELYENVMKMAFIGERPAPY